MRRLGRPAHVAHPRPVVVEPLPQSPELGRSHPSTSTRSIHIVSHGPSIACQGSTRDLRARRPASAARRGRVRRTTPARRARRLVREPLEHHPAERDVAEPIAVAVHRRCHFRIDLADRRRASALVLVRVDLDRGRPHPSRADRAGISSPNAPSRAGRGPISSTTSVTACSRRERRGHERRRARRRPADPPVARATSAHRHARATWRAAWSDRA